MHYFMIVLLLIPVNVFGYADLIVDNSNTPKDRAENISRIVNKYSEKYDVASDLTIAIMWHETDFRNVKGNTGEAGYMQIKPATFESVCHYRTTINRLIFDYQQNIKCAIKYFATLKSDYGRYSALSAYNAGLPINGNWHYVRNVLNRLEKVKQYE